MDPRTWESPNPPVLAAPDRFLPARLLLDDAWLSPAGAWRPIGDVPTAGLWSILGYLRWHAPELRALDPDGDGQAGPDAFLGSRPLVRAIDAELARRGEIDPGEALVTLGGVGPAPWELSPDPRVSRRRRAVDGRRSDDRARRPCQLRS